MGRLGVGAFSTALAALVPRAIGAFSSRWPRMRVLLREGGSPTQLSRLVAKRLDVAVVTMPERRPDDIAVTKLLDDPLLVAVPTSHRLARLSAVPPNQLREERWVAGSAEPTASLLGAWTGEAWKPEIAFVAKDWSAKLGLVAAGQAVTVVPGLAATAMPASVSLVRIDHPDAQRTIAIASRSVDETPGTSAFCETLRDTAADLGAELRRRLGETP